MVEIKHANKESKGIFELYYDGKKAGLMTYSWAGDDKFIIDHTEVDEEYGGKGLGKDLVKAGVEYAREKNVKVIPLCPFAKKVIAKTPESQDVLS